MELYRDGLEAKFTQNSRAMQALLETGNKKLIECAKDTLWGTGVPLNQPNCLNEKFWKGQGILGEILQEIIHKHMQIAWSLLPAINQWHSQGPPLLLHLGVEPCKPVGHMAATSLVTAPTQTAHPCAYASKAAPTSPTSIPTRLDPPIWV